MLGKGEKAKSGEDYNDDYDYDDYETKTPASTVDCGDCGIMRVFVNGKKITRSQLIAMVEQLRKSNKRGVFNGQVMNADQMESYINNVFSGAIASSGGGSSNSTSQFIINGKPVTKQQLRQLIIHLKKTWGVIRINGKDMTGKQLEQYLKQYSGGSGGGGRGGRHRGGGGRGGRGGHGGRGIKPGSIKLNGKPATKQQLMQLVNQLRQTGGAIKVDGQTMNADQFEAFIQEHYGGGNGHGGMEGPQYSHGVGGPPHNHDGGGPSHGTGRIGIMVNGKPATREQLMQLVKELKQTGGSVQVNEKDFDAAQFEAFVNQHYGSGGSGGSGGGMGGSSKGDREIMINGKPATREQLIQLVKELKQTGGSVQVNEKDFDAAQFEAFVNQHYGSGGSGGSGGGMGGSSKGDREIMINGKAATKAQLMQIVQQMKASGEVILIEEEMNGDQFEEYVNEIYGSGSGHSSSSGGGGRGSKGVGDDPTVIFNSKTTKKSQLMALLDQLRRSGQTMQLNGKVYTADQFEEYINQLFHDQNGWSSTTHAELEIIFKTNGARGVLAKLGKNGDNFQVQRNYTCITKKEAEDKYGKDQMSSLPKEAYSTLNTTSYLATGDKDPGIDTDLICQMEIFVTPRENFCEYH